MSLIRPTLSQVLQYGKPAVPAAGELPWESRRAGRPFDPSQIAGLELDLWASRGVVLSGSNVTSWTDFAEGAVFTSGGTVPVFNATGLGGKPTIDFTGTQSLTATVAIAAGDRTWYLWVDVLDTVATRIHFGLTLTGAGRQYLYQTNPSGNVGFFDGTSVRSFGASATGGQSLIWRLVSGGTSEGYRAGASIGTSATAALVATDGAVGGRNPTVAAQFANMRVGRLLSYSGNHDAATRAQILGWGVSFYGV